MTYDIDAILKAYSGTVIAVDSEEGAFDKDGKNISSTLDQNLIDDARAEIDKQKYKQQRAYEYPDIGTQLDYIYHNGIDKWKTDIVDPVKAKYPKPS